MFVLWRIVDLRFSKSVSRVEHSITDPQLSYTQLQIIFCLLKDTVNISFTFFYLMFKKKINFFEKSNNKLWLTCDKVAVDLNECQNWTDTLGAFRDTLSWMLWRIHDEQLWLTHQQLQLRKKPQVKIILVTATKYHDFHNISFRERQHTVGILYKACYLRFSARDSL